MANVQVPNLAAQVAAVSLREEDAQAINFDQVSLKAPYYKLRQIPQVSGGNTVTLSANSTAQSIFNVPNETFNFARSYLSFDATFNIAAVGTVGADYANTACVLLTDCVPIDNWKFKPSAGDPIAQVTNAQLYSKISQALTTDLNQYLSRGGVYGDTVLNTAYPVTECIGCQPFSSTVTQTSLQIPSAVPSPAYIVNSTSLVNVRPATQVSGVTNDEKSPQRLVAGTFASGASPVTAASQVTVRFKIPLSAFSGTVLAIDRSICYGQIMQLWVNWSAINQWGWVSINTAAANGAAPATPAAIGSYSMSNLWLYLQNDISTSGQEIMALANSTGLQMNIPYTDCAVYTGGAAGTQSAPYNLTPGTGTLLKRVMFLATNNTNTLVSTANLDNVNASRFANVQSYLDGKPNQDYPLAVADNTLWQYMYPKIKDSAVCLDKRNYEINCSLCYL